MKPADGFTMLHKLEQAEAQAEREYLDERDPQTIPWRLAVLQRATHRLAMWEVLHEYPGSALCLLAALVGSKHLQLLGLFMGGTTLSTDILHQQTSGHQRSSRLRVGRCNRRLNVFKLLPCRRVWPYTFHTRSALAGCFWPDMLSSLAPGKCQKAMHVM